MPATGVFSESESVSVVKDERVENAFTRPCVSLSAESRGSGLATLGVWGRLGCGFRALSGSSLRSVQLATRGGDDRLTVREDRRRRVCRVVVVRGLGAVAAEGRRRREQKAVWGPSGRHRPSYLLSR